MKPPTNHIVLQCPACGARAGLHSGKTRCSQTGHSLMVPAWSSTGKLLTPKEIEEQNLLHMSVRDGAEEQA